MRRDFQFWGIAVFLFFTFSQRRCFVGLDQGQNPLQNQQKGAGGGLTIPWTEFVSRQGWAGDGSYRVGETRVVRHLIIHFSNLDTAIREVLGYSFRTLGGRLSRVLPMRDPHFTWTYASAITSIRGIKFIGKNAGGGHGPYADYSYAIISVLFTTPPYAVKSDTDIIVNGSPYEWRRFVEKRFDVVGESLNTEAAELKFGANYTPPNQTIHRQYPFITFKTNLSWTWVQVPDVGLFSGGGYDEGGRPEEVLACLGKVNSVEFEGWQPETLLFFPPRFEPYVMPVPPHVLNLAPNAVPRSWNVTMNMVGWEVSPLGANEVTTGGWTKVPSILGTWFTVTRTGGAKLYGEIDFARAFLMNQV